MASSASSSSRWRSTAPAGSASRARAGRGGATGGAGGRRGERRPMKQAKAEDRFRPDRRTERFKEAFRDIVGGKPSEGLAAVGEETVAATREAGTEGRESAERLAQAADPTRQKNGDD